MSDDDHIASAHDGTTDPVTGTAAQDSTNFSGVGSIIAHPGEITITTHLWFAWMWIAIEHVHAAHSARDDMKRAYNVGNSSAASELLNQEFQASLVAVSAAAHALDAFYGSTVIPQTAHKLAQNRRGNIREALKRVFNTGKVNTPWVTEFE